MEGKRAGIEKKVNCLFDWWIVYCIVK